MSKSFKIRDDWFRIRILPAVRRRNLIAAAIWVLCLTGWLYNGYMFFAIIFFLSLVERIYENATISNIQEIVDSISISVNDAGITMKSKGAESGIYHPWSSLTFNEIVSDNPTKDKIILKYKDGKIELFGYENQQRLREIIHDNVPRS